jgi:hypothetical protein
MTKPKILVTATVLQLLDKGFPVRAFVRRLTIERWNLVACSQGLIAIVSISCFGSTIAHS